MLANNGVNSFHVPDTESSLGVMVIDIESSLDETHPNATLSVRVINAGEVIVLFNVHADQFPSVPVNVLIAPVEERITINPIGNIELEGIREEANYSPSIDMVISDMAERYGSRAGAIIFSGMGDDGKIGCAKLLEQGGQIWLQSSESCVISSMPDNVKRSCDIHFTGNPEQLAKQLSKHLQISEVV